VKTLNFIENPKTNPATGRAAGKHIARQSLVFRDQRAEITRLNRQSAVSCPPQPFGQLLEWIFAGPSLPKTR
jgi:hypothetical protein